MRNFILCLFIALFTISSFSQSKEVLEKKAFNESLNLQQRDSLNGNFNKGEIEVELDGETHFTDYKIISHHLDTSYIDTTLTINKDYKFNFIRKDDFELLPFHNQGQTYTNLGYSFDSNSMFPKMGARAKYFNFKEVEDINYYEVPTPTSELMFRTGMEQGQVLDAFLTINTSPNFNFSVAYKGLRSLGKYRQSLASLGNFRTTFNYRTKNERYYARGHFVSHDFLNQENGGLTDESVALFESNDPNFTDRARLEVNYTNAENFLVAKRYFLDHSFKIFRKKDSIKSHPSNFKLGHQYTYKTKHYHFDQTAADTITIGQAFASAINDEVGLRTMNNLAYLELESPIVLGSLRAKANYYSYDHYYNGVVNIGSETIDAQLKGNALSIGAEWNAKVKNFNVKADISSIISGDLEGNHLMAAATYKRDSLFSISAKINMTSKSPNFNFLHNQSDYIEYNWQNTDFKNEEIRNLSFDLKSEKLLNASASITQIDNYTYFDTNSKPAQANEAINYLKIKAKKAIKFGKFTLDNTLMYQKVAKGDSLFRVPEFVTRNSLFYSNYLFKKKPLYLQTGFTFKYFTQYQMNAYNPLLSEFNLQNDAEYGGYPVVDFFANGQVRRTRIYLKVENITASFTGRNYYAAPLEPYRDLTVRFGLVWNFFI